MSESDLRQAISEARRSPEGVIIGKLAESHDVPIDRAYEIYMEESEAYKLTPEYRAALRKSARTKIYLGIPLHLIPPVGWVVTGLGVADEAEAKGQSRVYGVFGLIGLLLVILMPDRFRT